MDSRKISASTTHDELFQLFGWSRWNIILSCPFWNDEKWGSDEELYYVQNASLIHFSVYTYQGRWSTYVIFPNLPSVCTICKENYDINIGIIKSPTYEKHKQLTKMSYHIGELKVTLSTWVKEVCIS